ncbi:MAG: choice-of-anchor J domain-containing protein [Acidobacteriota bacterium]
MGTLDKRTHRPLALFALFMILAAVGWQLPRVGQAVLAYSNQAMKAAGDALAAKTKVSAKSAVPASADDPTDEQLKIVRMMLADLDGGGEYSREEQYLLGKVRAESSLSPLEVQTLISRVLYEEYVTKRPYTKGMARLLAQYRGFVRTSDRTIEDEKPGGEKGQSLMSPGKVSARTSPARNVKASPEVAITSAFSEAFDDITTLPGAGWSLQNLSNPVGTIGWFQGNDAVFPAQAGATTAYIGANFNNTGSVGNISNWLLTPEIGLKNGDVIKFWSRKPAVTTDFPDRLEVRMSTAGASTNVGASDTSVGDFTTLLLSINPTLTTGVYPQVWTQFTVTISGLGAATTGRVGFRYFVTNGGLNGANSDYIGIDTFEYAPVLSQAVIMGTSATLTAESCTPANNVPDPGETVTISMCLKNTGATAAANIVATLVQNPAAGILNPSAPQSYGAIPNDGTPVCRSFTFTVPSNTVCGGTVMPSFTISDNGVPLTPVSFTLAVGTTNAPTTVTTFTQNTVITVPTVVGNATPYPSALAVAGVTGTVVGVKVKLNGVNHTFPDDLDILLVGPTGAGVILMSDAGGGTDLVNTNLTIADGSPYMPDATTLLAGGTFAPTNHGTGDVFSAPAPPIPAGGPLNALFAGQNPNGTWNLFVTDQFTGDGGSITSWSLELTTTSVTPVIASTPFTNATAINLPADPPGSGAATPYPSNINVSGVTGSIINIAVTLNGVSHTFPNDMDLLLVGPTGVGYTVLSDVGGGAPGLSNVTFTLQDSSTPITTVAGSLTAGTFRPTNSGTGDTFPAPAPGTFQLPPSAGVASLLGTYGALNANGTWSLYAVDDLGGDTGALAGGWTLTFTTINFPTSCSTCPTCTVTPPANITVANDANQCGAVVNYPAPTTTGTCGTVTCSPASGSFFPKGTTTIQCISTSGGGFGSFTVTVNDTQPPVITCPANIAVPAAAGLCTAVVTFAAPTVSDNCPGVGTPVCVPASGSTFQKGTTTVNCTVLDASTNTAACSFTVTVNDTQAPTITCPANIFVGTTGATQVVTYPLPVVGDNCPGVQVPVCVPASGSAFAVGVTTVNCSVRDAVNNTSTCAFQVTVNKVGAPTLSDPLACTGPGNVISGSFSVTNSGGASATVAATVTLSSFPTLGQFLALPGTCVVAGAGTCTVVNATTITYSSTLAAGASATISYQLQVGDLATPLTVLTSTVVTSFNGGPPLTASASLSVNCQAVGPGAAYPAGSEVSDQKAGSVLVYPIYTSAVGATTQDSRISITNTHLNLRAWVHLFFVSDSCAVSDAFICLTPNQTSTFLASDLDPGTTGYLVAVASDGVTGCPVNFNYLIGDAYVKFTSGHAANLGAEAISAIPGSAFFASCNANAVASTLAFDGVSYNRLPYVLAVDNIGSRADGNDTIVILDRIGGDLRTGPSGVGNIFGVFYNDAEQQLSFTLNSTSCQYRFTVNNTTPRITPRFDQFVTAGRTGWIKFYQRDGAGLLGSVINFNPNAVTSAGAFSQGHNLHKLTLTNTASYIIPIFPPSC